MKTIKVLPEILANKIAAGEVIERPSSIVKELVENSLDAGSQFIDITIHNGGKSLIRVADDGFGIQKSEIELAFQRHATSKISTDEDLDKIASYGFRGEALPSIAAVSRLKMISRPHKTSFGTEIQIEGGRTISVKEAACQEGTVVEVRDLFFNTPARRKFMKADATELGHTHDMILNLSLSRLDVHFVFRNNEKKVFDLPKTSDLHSRAALLLGYKDAKDFLVIHEEVPGVKIRGVIGKPSLAFANRSGQSFFINQRWIKSVSWSYALQAGFHGRLMHGQYPVAVLMVDCDLSRVDVNVHPTKQEVRITNESTIKSLIQQAVSIALSKSLDLAPKMTPIEATAHVRSDLPVSVDWMRERASPSYKQTTQTASVNISKEPIPSAASQVQMEPYIAKAEEFVESSFVTKVLGQIHGTFIVAETVEGLMIVDQHAAHERIQFETVMKGFQTGNAAKQHLLMDEIMDVHSKDLELFKSSLEFFQKTGFDIDEFGKNSFVIRSMPAAFIDENPIALIKQYLQERTDGKIKTTLGNRQEDIAALIACKRKSVKAHESMTLSAMRDLLQLLFKCENPFGCPHGRPSFFKYSFDDLEKQFKKKL